MGEIADQIVEGSQCSHCGVNFKNAHGYPVLCDFCWDELPESERENFSKAESEEI